MLIDLNELKSRELPLLIRADFTEQQLEIEGKFLSLGEPVHCEMKVRLVADSIVINGALEANLRLICCRCASSFARKLDKQFSVEYCADPEVATEGEEFELSYGDLSVGFYRGDQFDLCGVVSEQVWIDVPMKPVCHEDCKGLCSHCGVDLNQEECGCEESTPDPRLAVLKGLKDRMSK